MPNPFAVMKPSVNAFSAIKGSNPFAAINNTRTDEPEDKQSMFWDVIDVISRPQRAVTTGIKNVLDEDNNTTLLGGLRDGITGKSKQGTGDILEDLGWNPDTTAGKVAKGITSFAGDVALDPLTYVPGGVLTKIPGAGKALSKARNIPGIKQTLDKGADLFGFKPSNIDSNVWDTLKEAEGLGRGKVNSSNLNLINMGKEIGPDINSITKSGDSLDDIIPSIERYKEGSLEGAKGDLASKVLGKQQDIKSRYEALGGKAIDDGEIRHMAHILNNTDNTKSFEGSKLFSSASKSDLQRQVMNYHDEVTGELIHAGKKAKDLNLKKTDDGVYVDSQGKRLIEKQSDVSQSNLFEKDPLKVIATMERRMGRKEGGAEFMKHVAKLGEDVPTASHSVQASDSLLGGKYFEPAVAERIEKTFKAFTTDEPTNEIMKLFDKVQGAWKTSATVVNIPFHTRNAVSNIWQNYLGGLGPNSIKHYSRAIKDMVKMQKTGKADHIKEFMDQGLINPGFVGGLGLDAEKTLKELTNPSKNPFSRIANKLGGGGQFIENASKLAHYYYKRSKGLDPQKAAASVKTHLFDYEDLAPFEKNVMKRIFPFYTWSRKNLPLQLQKLATEPGKFANLGKVKENIEQFADPVNTEFMNDKVSDRSLIQIPGNEEEGGQHLAAEGFIPSVDINKLKDPASLALEMLSPLIKTPMELTTNKNLYFDSPISKFEGDTTAFWKDLLGDNAPAIDKKTAHILRSIRPLNDIERVFGEREGDRDLMSKILGYLSGAKVRANNPEDDRYWSNYDKKQNINKIKQALKKNNTPSERKSLLETLQQLQRG